MQSFLTHAILFIIIIILLEDNCFTIFCWFLPYVNINQPQVYIYPFPPKSPSHPMLLSRLSQSTGLTPCITQYTGSCVWLSSHLLSALHAVMYMFPYYSLNLSHPALPPLWLQVLFSMSVYLMLPCT